MSEQPYAYQRWQCSTCDGEPIQEDDGTLRCEYCGHGFEIQGRTGFAHYIPYEEDMDVNQD